MGAAELLDADRARIAAASGASRLVALAAGGELLADHPQRQELVALQPQDRPQALDVGLAVEAVAARRAPRGEQLLVLEVADLRDRDVVELLARILPRRRSSAPCGSAPSSRGAGLVVGAHRHFSR